MKTKVMETIIRSKTASQNTVSGEKEELVTVGVPEIAKKVLRVLTKIKNKLMIKEVLKKEKIK